MSDSRKSETVFIGHGIEILLRHGEYYLEFDSGGSVSRMLELKVSKAEANEAMKSEKKALAVIIKAEKTQIPREKPNSVEI